MCAALHRRLVLVVAAVAFCGVPTGASPRVGRLLPRPSAAETVLYSFPKNSGPTASLMAGDGGALYGTTGAGGVGFGTVFKATPSSGRKPWTVRVLNNFTFADGAFPDAGLVADQTGALYGTTTQGGKVCFTAGCGVVFRLTRPPPHQYYWTETVIHYFTGSQDDGLEPHGALVMDAAGALYGTTVSGGIGDGVVFKLTPPIRGTHWREQILYTFSGLGATPYGGLIGDGNGVLYGTTVNDAINGCGTVYAVAPPVPGSAAWSERLLYVFGANGSGDGCGPRTSLAEGRPGTLYGTTTNGGAAGMGAVFAVSRPAVTSSMWIDQVLHSFTGGADGAGPSSPVTVGEDGAIYGTCYAGGAANDGVVFKLTPPRFGQTAWTETILHSFAGGADGANPVGGLLRSSGGVLYGTTSNGGVNGGGTIFEVVP
jgi:uncharacterized repeat protein (TIGR03803 family)